MELKEATKVLKEKEDRDAREASAAEVLAQAARVREEDERARQVRDRKAREVTEVEEGIAVLSDVVAKLSTLRGDHRERLVPRNRSWNGGPIAALSQALSEAQRQLSWLRSQN